MPYGKERIIRLKSDYKNKYRFIGKEKDAESDLGYFEARYYDSNIGRFIEQDRVFWELGQTKRGTSILSDPQQLNSYSYARNNPVILSDPSGEFVETIWDTANVVYDAGRFVKNVGEIIGGSVAYGVGKATNDPFLIDAAKQQLKEDVKDLGEASLDVGTDSVAAIIPFVPAGTTKLVRAAKAGEKLVEVVSGAKKAEGAIDIIKAEEKLIPKIGSKGGEGGGKVFSQKTKDAAFDEAGGKCVFCGKDTNRKGPSSPNKSEIDHAVSRKNGGNNSPENAQNTCRDCNRKKGSNNSLDFQQKISGGK